MASEQRYKQKKQVFCTHQQNMNFLTVEELFSTEKQYLQAFTKQQEILSILTSTKNPQKKHSSVNLSVNLRESFKNYAVRNLTLIP